MICRYYEQVMDQYGKFYEDIKAGKIVSAYALDGKGIAAGSMQDGIW